MQRADSFALRTRFTRAAALFAVVVVASCGGSSPSDSSSPESTAAVTSLPASETISALVTNDDGIGAKGIDVLLAALESDSSISFEVWAPAENQSGTGDKTTPGGLPSVAATTLSGISGNAVAGFPADSVLAAIAGGVKFNVVLSGINSGQNIGPFVKLSGTVGAAATAARKGYWALAVSQGLAASPAFDTAAPLVLQWIKQYGPDILAGKPARLFNLNVPTCATGTLRPLVAAPVALDFNGRKVGKVNCDGPDLAGGSAVDDVDAFLAGHAVLSELDPVTLAPIK